MLQAITEELERSFDSRDESETQLLKCPDCGVVGLPERIETHDCQGSLNTRKEESTQHDTKCISAQQLLSITGCRPLIQTMSAVGSITFRLFKPRELAVNNCCTQLR
jgi:hypothetical protein